MPSDPVQPIPVDEPTAQPEPGIALCLSGGCYRAVCDAALRKHVDPALKKPDGFPYPAAGV
jgi:hypothetical protein